MLYQQKGARQNVFMFVSNILGLLLNGSGTAVDQKA